MLATARSLLVRGLDAIPVEVQVDIGAGEYATPVVGLATASVREAKERVRSAVRNSGLRWPRRRTTINLAPAEVRKEGTAFDLPIAVAVSLAESGRRGPEGAAFLGQLALDGSVLHVAGVLVAARAARRLGIRRLYVPAADAAEAALVDGVEVMPCATFGALMQHLLEGQELPPPPPVPAALEAVAADELAEVHGQVAGRRALEIAAAGGHHLLMSGPPGAGKTMLARCLPGLLPPLDREQAIEVAQVRSVLGELRPGAPLSLVPPFRAPHHSTSEAGLVGGGTGFARPGEVTRADHGVLFLDELAEWSPAALQSLRQPLEDGHVTVTRSLGGVRYPSRFQLVAATNPCPCGWLGDARVVCRCSAAAVDRYRRALSGPLLDRIDLQVEVARPPLQALGADPTGETSAAVRERVVMARRRQLDRQGGPNARLGRALLRSHARLGPPARRALEGWAEKRGLTGRGFLRAWRVARTLADLAGEAEVGEEHVLEALGFRLADAA